MASGAYADRRMTHTETMQKQAGIPRAVFENIDFTDLTYIGEAGKTTFDIEITYMLEDADEDDFEELLDEFGLDVTRHQDHIVFHLVHPRRRDGFSFWPFRSKKADWRVILNVHGPSDIDLDIDADFSEIRTAGTEGYFKLDASFSESDIETHYGRLVADIDFGELDGEGISGGFDVDGEFSDIDIRMSGISEESNASVHFGDIDIHLPRGTSACFKTDKSFGDIDFDVDGELSYQSPSNTTRFLNQHNPNRVDISLETSFGEITVHDDMPDVQTLQDDNRTGKTSAFPPGRSDYDIDYEFTGGIISEIKIRGTRFVDDGDVMDILGIESGKSYTKDDIGTAVDGLAKKNKRIHHASFTIDRDGLLSVYIDEEYPYQVDFDGRASYSRVGGAGLGPGLTISSVYGPISEIGGSAEYHFANKEWTYDLKAGTEFFATNTLGIGVTHRLAYESVMDWALHEDEASANAFLLGRESINLYEVEGTTGYISQSVGRFLTAKAEYFEEDYRSLKKHTNWSLFNANHKKYDNPPIGSGYDDTISGMRYDITFRHTARRTNTTVHISAEQALDTGSPVIPEYTRYLGTLALNNRLAYVGLIKLRLAGGYSDDLLPPQKSFRLGGTGTLRGYDPGMVPAPPAGADGYSYLGGGNRMMLANIDYFTGDEHDDLRLVLFGDIGGVWRKGEEADMKDLRRDLGIGLALSGDFFTPEYSADKDGDHDLFDIFRINWAVPVGNVAHTSYWTVNFVRTY